MLGEILGGGYACEAQGLTAIRDDGDGLARAMGQALDDAQLGPPTSGWSSRTATARRNPTFRKPRRSAASSAPRPRRSPAFKWAIGHTIAAAGILETALALAALARGTVPGVANLERLDPACAGLPVSAAAQAPRSKVALILCRGFAGTNAALVVRAA